MAGMIASLDDSFVECLGLLLEARTYIAHAALNSS